MAARHDEGVLVDAFDAHREWLLPFGASLPEQPHDLVPSGAIPRTRVDPAQGDLRVEDGL
jgi:hypothetical protein